MTANRVDIDDTENIVSENSLTTVQNIIDKISNFVKNLKNVFIKNPFSNIKIIGTQYYSDEGLKDTTKIFTATTPTIYIYMFPNNYDGTKAVLGYCYSGNSQNQWGGQLMFSFQGIYYRYLNSGNWSNIYKLAYQTSVDDKKIVKFIASDSKYPVDTEIDPPLNNDLRNYDFFFGSIEWRGTDVYKKRWYDNTYDIIILNSIGLNVNSIENICVARSVDILINRSTGKIKIHNPRQGNLQTNGNFYFQLENDENFYIELFGRKIG